MRHLAIECSGFGGSVSLFQHDLEIACRALPSNVGSVRTLAPAIEELIRQDNKVLAPEFISVTTGPGSFTGLRVGLATAKMLAFAWQVPLVAVDTLECIALRTADWGDRDSGSPIVAVVNAYRKQVFAAAWTPADGRLLQHKPTQVMNAQDWQAAPLDSLADASAESSFSRAEKITVTGPGLREYPLADKLVASAMCAISPEAIWDPTSNEVGRIGLDKFLQGDISTAETLGANYIRQSAAEEARKRQKD